MSITQFWLNQTTRVDLKPLWKALYWGKLWKLYHEGLKWKNSELVLHGKYHFESQELTLLLWESLWESICTDSMTLIWSEKRRSRLPYNENHYRVQVCWLLSWLYFHWFDSIYFLCAPSCIHDAHYACMWSQLAVTPEWPQWLPQWSPPACDSCPTGV